MKTGHQLIELKRRSNDAPFLQRAALQMKQFLAGEWKPQSQRSITSNICSLIKCLLMDIVTCMRVSNGIPLKSMLLPLCKIFWNTFYLYLTIAPVQFFLHASRYIPPSPVVNISTLPQESDNEEATNMTASPQLIKSHVLYYISYES